MGLLILAVILAISQASSPVPRKAADGTSSARQNVAENAQANKKPSAPTPSVLKPVAANPQQNSGDAPQAKNAEQTVTVSKLPSVSVARDWADWVLWAFDGLLVIAGFLGIRVAYKTMGKIGEQTEATKDAAKAARDNVKLLINKERARLQVDMVDKPIIAPNDAPIPINEVNCLVKCFGTTHATILENKTWGEINSQHRIEGLSCGTPGNQFLAMALPFTIMPTTDGVPVAMPLGADSWTIDMLELVAKREKFVHFEGFIRYTDIFEGTWIYTFQFMWAQNMWISNSLDGKWIGTGKEEKDEETSG